jgi:hypothetical protein
MMRMLNQRIGKMFGRAVGCPCDEDLFDFALDGLDLPTQSKVREHLSLCPRCADQVKDYAWVSEGIALCAPQAEPPAGLCDRVKDRIRSEGMGGRVSIEYRDKVMQGWPLFWLRLGPVFACSSVLMACAALWAMLQMPKPQPALQGAEALLSSSTSKHVALSGMGAGASSSGELTLQGGSDTVLLSVKDLAPCAQGRFYTLWELSSGKTLRLAGFQTESPAACTYVLHLAQPMSLDPGATFQVSLEQSGKSPQLQQGPLYLHGDAKL